MMGRVVFTLSVDFHLLSKRSFLLTIDSYGGICFSVLDDVERRLTRLESLRVFSCLDSLGAALDLHCCIGDVDSSVLESKGVDSDAFFRQLTIEGDSRPRPFEENGAISDFYSFCYIQISVRGMRYTSYSSGGYALPWGNRGNCNPEICDQLNKLLVLSRLEIRPDVLNLFTLPLGRVKNQEDRSLKR